MKVRLRLLAHQTERARQAPLDEVPPRRLSRRRVDTAELNSTLWPVASQLALALDQVGPQLGAVRRQLSFPQ